jgi:hypothetical protein
VSQHFATRWLNNNANLDAYEFGDIIDSQPVMIRVHPKAQSMLPKLNKAMQKYQADIK